MDLRAKFPLLDHNPDLIYLDSATTTQKPESVIEAIDDFYRTKNANTGRGNYKLAEQADFLLDQTRKKVAQFVGVDTKEIIFTPNVTDSINQIAYMLLNSHLQKGEFQFKKSDNIVVSKSEHHANFVPWFELTQKVGIELRVLDLTPEGYIDTDKLSEQIDQNTRLVAFTQASNVTGCIMDVEKIITSAHQVNALTIMDACQSVPHLNVDFKKLDVDFAGFSGHKMYSGFGVGILYGKNELLEQFNPVNYGGGIVGQVDETEITYQDSPMKYEAGTKNLEAIYSLGFALDFYQQYDKSKMLEAELKLTEKLLEINNIPHVEIIGPKNNNNRIGVVSFTVDDIHPHDVAQFLDSKNICVRAGHHCAQPLHRFFGISASTRASLGVYNSVTDIEKLIESLSEIRSAFKL